MPACWMWMPGTPTIETSGRRRGRRRPTRWPRGSIRPSRSCSVSSGGCPMPREPRDDPAPSPTAPARPFKPQLVTTSDLESAIATVCRMFDKYVTAEVLTEYLAALSDLSPPLVYQAVKAWIRQPPENRAPRPHELRAL